MATDMLTHEERVRRELRDAGATSYGLMKSSLRYVHNIVHEDEPVEAVAYGRYEGGSGTLVGTDRRILFIDHKPGYTTIDELSFEAVGGVKVWTAGPFESLTLHTASGDYQLRYVNPSCAKHFLAYIERIRELRQPPNIPAEVDALYQAGLAMEPEAKAFLLSHDVGVLSSVDRHGNVFGAAVYYLVKDTNRIYVLTRSGTAKANNILAHHQVALTIFDENPARTLQLQGQALVETDQSLKDEVFTQMMQPRLYKGGLKAPPVTQYHAGGYMVIGIVPTALNYHAYQKAEEV